MTKLLSLQLRIAIAALISDLDPFETIRWVSIDCTDGMASEVDVNSSAAVLSQTAIALAWEAVCCALPNATNARIEMAVEGITHNATYNKVIIQPNSFYNEWSPDLSALMKTIGDHIEKDMVTLLTDISKNSACVL